ncbi:MAG: tRNA uridine-5-carboxymethylaminomethyl(34) synthesis GTPase MnmE [Ruminococcaceae bacterium]|nr:tRNA uridine-5-carboxymethylaminomethyl(34) synthesis GTPase MnmE [Oscillospiraceae bacterium]
MKIFDTIAAVSTPRGKGGVAVIRISGAEALEIASRVFLPRCGKSLSEIEPSRAVYGDIIDYSATESGEPIDDGLAVTFRAPRSFTGEDTVEISCHGGALITKCVLSSVLSAGARAAEAGEFTRRAFLNGKMRLNEAEALGDLLDAESTEQIRLARGGMKGLLTEKTSSIYDGLCAMLSSIYARIDFPDEDLSEMTEGEMRETLEALLGRTEALASTYRTGKAINDGIRTAICGRTNAGKSSVYNRLAGEDAAIVTDIEGTTRDLLRETVTLGKTLLRICDTAGLRATDNTVESIGIERAIAEIEASELILAVFDRSKELSADDMSLIHRLSALDTPVIALLNKSDLAPTADEALLRNSFKHTVEISAKDGEGFDRLASLIDSLFIDGDIDLSKDAVVADARQFAALRKAADSLRSALTALCDGVSLDLICIDVEVAMQALSDLEGRDISEEIVSEIFSKFCVGK